MVRFGVIDGRQIRLTRGCEKRVLILDDPARDHDLAGDCAVHVLDISACPSPFALQFVGSVQSGGAVRKPRAQIAVADLSQSLQMRNEPRAVFRIWASASPTNDYRGHEKYSSRIEAAR